jgi:hypothetical protein
MGKQKWHAKCLPIARKTTLESNKRPEIKDAVGKALQEFNGECACRRLMSSSLELARRA